MTVEGTWHTVDDLTAFLNARLDEDEQYARDPDGWNEYDPGERGEPARVLRDVEAKRRIVDDYRISVNACRNVTGTELDSPGYKSMCGGRDAFRSACAALAAVYSDHPDYRPGAPSGA